MKKIRGGGINVLAFTETECRGGRIGEIPVYSMEECQKLKYDLVVIASLKIKEITDEIKRKNIFDFSKVICFDKFYPEDDGLTLSQINAQFFLNKLKLTQNNLELVELYEKFEDKKNFIDIKHRRRFIEDKGEMERYRNIEVFYDVEEKLKYVYVDEKKLYYPGNWSDEKVTDYHALNTYTCHAEASAHKYLTADFNVGENDIVADIGAAEGLFALDVVDKVKRVYVFEADQEWLPALRATFKPYKEKVILEKAFVSNLNQWEYITGDSYFKDKEINLIKMDVEGEEQKVLLGCKELLQRKNMRWVITTYHRSEDMEFIDAYMKMNGYITERGDHWLWIDHIDLDVKLSGEFRKAILRAEKNI